MRIVGDYPSYHNLYDECYEDGFLVVISGLFSVGLSSTKYKGWIMNDKRLGEKNEISLCVSHTLSLPLPLSLRACTCLYVGRYSFPSNLTFTFTFTYTKFQITASSTIPYHTIPYLTEPYGTFTQNRIIPSHAYIHLCTVLYRIYNM